MPPHKNAPYMKPLELRRRLGRTGHHVPKAVVSAPIGQALLACSLCGGVFRVGDEPLEEPWAFVCPGCKGR
jgi:hypothetical protein